MAGWLRGTVKEVLSGDSLTIAAGAGKGNAPPAEKRLTLSSLIAPKLVRACVGMHLGCQGVAGGSVGQPANLQT